MQEDLKELMQMKYHKIQTNTNAMFQNTKKNMQEKYSF